MIVGSDKNDIRIARTQNSLFVAMTKLLKQRSFSKITVLDLCEEAQIGRATFYAHFNDKYALLKDWLEYFKEINPFLGEDLRLVKDRVNSFFLENAALLKNIIFEADYETLDIMSMAVLRLFGMLTDEDELASKSKPSTRRVVLNTFFAGGVVSTMFWQVNNYFPDYNKIVNDDFIAIVEQFKKWNEE